MKEEIGLYMKELERKKHLLQLVKNIKLSIVLEINSKEYWLFFQNGMIRKSVDSLKDFAITRISGDKQAISSLLDGKLKLRTGEANKLLKVSASFRHKLLLESIFYLGGVKSL